MTFSLSLPSRRLVLVVALGCLLLVTYLLAYGGIHKANDELWLADATQSVALHGSYELNQTQFTRTNAIIPKVEPLQPILAAPLYWIAYHVPWAGNMHVLYLFNPFITALTAILLFFYVLLLGYRERTALVAALLYGLTTCAVPYTRGFFREPLTSLNLLAAAYAWERWRQVFVAQAGRTWRWFGLAALLSSLALLSKEVTLILLPIFFLLAFPGITALRRSSRDTAMLLGASGLFALGAVLVVVFQRQLGAREGGLGSTIGAAVSGLPWVPGGLAGLLISPGRGMLWFSPVLLLALASPALLPRARWRESWLLLGMAVWFAAVYASIRRDQWFGGAGWGARFMLPLTPLLMMAALPAIERMLESARRWPRIALAALAALGLTVQIVASYTDVYDFSSYLQQNTGLPPWEGPAIWSIRWSQIVGGLLYLPRVHTDIMWFQKGIDWLALGLIAAGVLATGTVVWNLRPAKSHVPRLVQIGGILCPILVVALSVFVMWRSMPDPRYAEDSPQIERLKADLERDAAPEDTIMLSNWHYAYYFMNSYKGNAIWWGLPNSPGERFSPEQAPRVVSDKVEDLIARRGAQIIDLHLTGQRYFDGHPIWLVSDASPFLTWATRPVEWYLAKYAYFVSAKDYASNARLVEYLPLRAPSDQQLPRNTSGARFGGSIRLDGFDLDVYPASSQPDSLEPSDSLGLSLLWEATGPIATDYTVAVHLINLRQIVYAQQDRQPVVGFAPTSKWAPGEKVRDNFGFILPTDLPPGQYELWLTIYTWPSLAKLSVTGPDGQAIGDHMVLTMLTVK